MIESIPGNMALSMATSAVLNTL